MGHQIKYLTILRNHNLQFSLVILLAAVLRLYHLSSNPPSLYWEEVALGYDAYSILKTGKDYHGNSWPIVAFESFGDYKPSGYFYSLIPSIALFGLTEIAVRLPSALAGITAVYLIYHLAIAIKLSPRQGLMSSLILAITPWHIHFSRAAFEVNLATTLILAAVVLFIKSLEKPIYRIPSSLLAIFSMYTYHGLRIVAPFLLVWIALPHLSKLFKQRATLYSIIIALILLLPILLVFNKPEVQQRFQETSLFSTSEAVVRTNLLREQCGNTFICRAIYHRYWFWTVEIFQGMFKQLNPIFLTLQGDHHPRHQTSSTKQLYIWQMLTIVFGLMHLLIKKPIKSNSNLILYYLIGWIVIASIPAALTNDTPHALRFLPAVPAYVLLSSIGLIQFIKTLATKKEFVNNLLYILLFVYLIGSISTYLKDYYHDYPRKYGLEWQYGYKEVIQFLIQQYPNHQVNFTRAYGRPSMYVLFYKQIDPKVVQSLSGKVPQDQGELLQLPNFTFGNNPPLDAQILVTDRRQDQGKLIKQVYSIDHQPVFYIYENN